MKFLLRVAILFTCLIGAILIVGPFFLDNSSLKLQIEKNLSSELRAEFKINQNVNLLFFPSPRVVLNRTNITNLKSDDDFLSINIKKLIIKFNTISLLKRQLKISEIVADSPRFELSPTKRAIAKSEKTSKDQRPKSGRKINSMKLIIGAFGSDYTSMGMFDFKDISEIKISNGIFIRRNSDSKVDFEFNDIVFDIANNSKKQLFTINGNFLSKKVPTEVEVIINTNQGKDSKFGIYSPILTAELKGKFSSSDIYDLVRSNFSGTISAEIIDIKGVFNNYFSNVNLIGKKINTPKPIKINAIIDSGDGAMSIDDIVISSELISGGGRIDINMAEAKPIIIVKMLLNSFDMDNIWPSGIIDQSVVAATPQTNEDTEVEEDEEESVTEVDSANLKGGSIFNKIDLTADIKIKEVIYLGGILQDIDLYFAVSEKGNMALQPLLLKIPGSGILKVRGEFGYEGDASKFAGKVDVVGKNLQKMLAWMKIDSENIKKEKLGEYKATADILFSSAIATLNNVHLDLNDHKDFVTGVVEVDFSRRAAKISGDFVIDDFNIEDYLLAEDKDQYLDRGSLLNKILWLNTISSNTELNLNFKKLIYQNNVFKDQSLKLVFGQGYFKISNLKITTDKIDLSGFAGVNIANNSPRIGIGLKIKEFEYASAKNKKAEFVEQFFNLPSLNEFRGDINIEIGNMKIDNLEISNGIIDGEIKDGILELKDSKMDIYGGNFVYNGSIIVKSAKTINGSFELFNVDNIKLLDNILDIDNIEGISNVSGVVNAVGRNRQEFFDNLDIQAQFVSSKVVVNKFGINDLMAKMLYLKRNQKELKNPTDIIFNKKQKSFFKDAKGAIDIRRGNRINKLRVEASYIGINSVTTGSVDFNNNTLSGISQFIFLTGTIKKQIPIKVAISFAGKTKNMQKEANVDQVNQYIDAIINNKRFKSGSSAPTKETVNKD